MRIRELAMQASLLSPPSTSVRTDILSTSGLSLMIVVQTADYLRLRIWGNVGVQPCIQHASRGGGGGGGEYDIMLA